MEFYLYSIRRYHPVYRDNLHFEATFHITITLKICRQFSHTVNGRGNCTGPTSGVRLSACGLCVLCGELQRISVVCPAVLRTWLIPSFLKFLLKMGWWLPKQTHSYKNTHTHTHKHTYKQES